MGSSGTPGLPVLLGGRGRELWPDLARGLAVVSMVVAHTCPVGGVFVLSEFLTAPLFAALVAISLVLSWEKRGTATRWLLTNAARGVILIILGELAQPIYDQIVVVLQSLGMLTLVLVPLIPLLAHRPLVATGLGVGMAALSPVIMNGARLRMADLDSTLLTWFVDLLAASPYYRTTTFLAISLVAVGLLHLLRRFRGRRGPVLCLSGILTIASGLVLVGIELLGSGLHPYSGSSGEIVFEQLFVAAVIAWSAAVAELVARTGVPGWLAPLVATGRLALTAYILQLVILAALTALFLGGGRDDHWWVMFLTIALLVGFCWGWERGPLPRPVESLLRLPNRLLR